MTFLYTEDTSPATIDVTSQGFQDQTFQVQTGELFTAVGEFKRDINIQISNGNSIVNDTACGENSEIFLGAVYGNPGELTLTGFDNGDGDFTSIYIFQSIYVLANGPFTSIVDSAIITSDFQAGLFDANDSPQTIAGFVRLEVFRSETVVDVGAKYRDSQTFAFAMSATATSQASGIGCDSSASITV